MERLYRPTQLRSCIGEPLTQEEQHSLLMCLKSANLSVDTCLVEGSEALFKYVMGFLEHSAATQEEDLMEVEGAMLLIEQLCLYLGKVAPEGPVNVSAGSPPDPAAAPGPRLQGRWQMVVTTAGAWGPRLQYTPALEYFEVLPDLQHFRLDTKMGPMFMCFMGDLEWKAADYLHYRVTDVKVEAFGGSVHLPAPLSDNRLRAFALGNDTALVRSSSGGLLLMARPQ